MSANSSQRNKVAAKNVGTATPTTSEEFTPDSNSKHNLLRKRGSATHSSSARPTKRPFYAFSKDSSRLDEVWIKFTSFLVFFAVSLDIELKLSLKMIVIYTIDTLQEVSVFLSLPKSNCPSLRILLEYGIHVLNKATTTFEMNRDPLSFKRLANQIADLPPIFERWFVDYLVNDSSQVIQQMHSDVLANVRLVDSEAIKVGVMVDWYSQKKSACMPPISFQSDVNRPNMILRSQPHCQCNRVIETRDTKSVTTDMKLENAFSADELKNFLDNAIVAELDPSVVAALKTAHKAALKAAHKAALRAALTEEKDSP